MPNVVKFDAWAAHYCRSESEALNPTIASALMPVLSFRRRSNSIDASCNPFSIRDSVDLEAPTRAARTSKVIPLRSRKVRSGCFMSEGLHETQLSVNPKVAFRANDEASDSCQTLQMAQTVKIHAGKTPPRMHYIPEWSAKRKVRKAEIARAIGADKSLVTRWFDGTLPSEKYLASLAEYLGADEPAALFRHPDEDWLKRLFENRSEEERIRMLQTLETAFPKPAQPSKRRAS